MVFFFFPFIASRAPERLRTLKKVAEQCVWCGALQLALVETQQVTRVFFLPVHRGAPQEALVCERCGMQNPGEAERGALGLARCSTCGARVLDSSWAFCPQCGDALRG